MCVCDSFKHKIIVLEHEKIIYVQLKSLSIFLIFPINKSKYSFESLW